LFQYRQWYLGHHEPAFGGLLRDRVRRQCFNISTTGGSCWPDHVQCSSITWLQAAARRAVIIGNVRFVPGLQLENVEDYP